MPEILRGHNNRMVGQIENGVWVKAVKGSVHQLRKPPAWAIDAQVFDRVKERIQRIAIHDEEKGVTYWMTVHEFDTNKCVMQRPDSGKQYYCHLKDWHVKGQPAVVQQAMAL